MQKTRFTKTFMALVLTSLGVGSLAFSPLLFQRTLYLSPTHKNLAQRLEEASPLPERLFYEPQNENDLVFLEQGMDRHWRRYQKHRKAHALPFKGYVLNADPYDKKLGKISFLLGADCSHFAQRLLQLLGAPYPYASTKTLWRLAATEPQRPAGYSREYWETLRTTFAKVPFNKGQTDPRSLESGDLVVFNHGSTREQSSGHVAVVWMLDEVPYLLDARNHKKGLVLEPLDHHKSFRVLRYHAPLQPLDTLDLTHLLQKDYVRYPTQKKNLETETEESFSTDEPTDEPTEESADEFQGETVEDEEFL